MQAKGLWALGGFNTNATGHSVGQNAKAEFVMKIEPNSKLKERGVYINPYLSFHAFRKAVRGNSQGQNRTREIRPSGIVGGLAET